MPMLLSVCVQGSDAGPYRVVQLKSAELSAAALKAVLAFLYTERLDVAIEDVEAVLRVARKCKLRAVVRAITEEQRTLKYYFKSTRRDEGPRRRGWTLYALALLSPWLFSCPVRMGLPPELKP